MTRQNVVDELKKRVSKAGSKSRVARELGISDSYLGEFLAGKRELGPILAYALQLERVVTYKRKGLPK